MEVYTFSARPLPLSTSMGVVGVPVKRTVAPTKPKPFNLLADQRVAIKAERRKQMIKADQKRWREAATFRARPNIVTFREPFRPRIENHASQVNFDQLKRTREALRAVMEQERLWEEKQMEKVAVAKLRREQVHKAQPIRCYRELEPKAEIQITVPQSPRFLH
ncbi:targeting protein for Xklp2-like [Clupea harengus]|uniref:Targeting protein for Xklp2-like n=1 Tax=Clupea harengus TaxID=7950 RepID=A0A6P3VN99_CLUHA|nr:targeting protein for Xklp2-like [Clupea harengus]